MLSIKQAREVRDSIIEYIKATFKFNVKDSLHRQIRKERNIKEKLLLKRKETLLAEKLTKVQRSYFDMEDEYNKNVDKMTTKLLESLESKYDRYFLFSVRWSFV